MRDIYYLKTRKGVFKVRGSFEDVLTLMKLTGEGEVQVL